MERVDQKRIVEALVLADLFAYASHRLFHVVPLLWRFHAIHHSSEHLDWLASSRLHLVDIVATRAVAFVPLYVMGFSQETSLPARTAAIAIGMCQ